jgi:DNA-binding CsgD family transcriptional regulator
MAAEMHQGEVNSPQSPAGTPNDNPVRENPLSDREMEVSRLLVTGATNSEIARALVISPQTVKVHLRNVFEKLQVSSRTEASMVLLQRGWLTMPGVATAQAAPDALAAQASAPEVGLVDPEPLVDLPEVPQLWQWGVVAAAVLACVMALLLPGLLGRAKSPVGLLSDSGQTVIGKPAVEILPRWEAYPALPAPRSRLAVAQLGNRIYALGGEGRNGQTLDRVEVYALNERQWRSGPALPEPLANAAATVVGGQIVLAGGSALAGDAGAEVVVSDDLYIFDPASESWRSGGVLPSPLAGAALVVYEDRLFLIGGWDGAAMHDTIWQLPVAKLESATAADWTGVTRMHTAAAFLGATLVDGELVVVGGHDGKRELADAAAYAIRFNIWRRLPPMQTPRSGLAVVYDGMAVLALGGGWTRTITGHERFDPLTNQWSPLASPVRGEWRHLGAAFNEGSVYLIGGWSGDYLDSMLQYQSTFRALLPAIQNVTQ